MKTHHIILWWLVIIGALNWGLIGLLNYNAMAILLGEGTTLEKIAYDLIGLAAVLLLWKHYSERKK